jgi:hypothetical protein
LGLSAWRTRITTGGVLLRCPWLAIAGSTLAIAVKALKGSQARAKKRERVGRIEEDP